MLIKGDDVITGLPDAINTAKEISERLLNAIEPKETVIVQCKECKYTGTNGCILDDISFQLPIEGGGR